MEKADDEFGHILKAKTSIIGTILTTQARVDETRLKRAAIDRIPQLLELVRDVQRGLPAPGTIDVKAVA